MISANIRDIENIRLNGRFDRNEKDFPLNWTASGCEMKVKGSFLEVEITSMYNMYRPYVTFEVDGLRAQTFAPLKGTHVYPVFCSMNAEKAHDVRILMESQLFIGDSRLIIGNVKTDGEILKPDEKKVRIEFIGDSITSGEGGKGPKDFSEWMPMMFSASDNYARFTADKMKAEYQVVSLSGWGVMCAWNNDPDSRIPRIYTRIAADQKEYDFSYDPDYVVIALGTNDNNALNQPEFKNPETGETFKLTKEHMGVWSEKALEFLTTVHEKNPKAKIVWMSFFKESPIAEATKIACENAQKAGIPAHYACTLDLHHLIRGGMGSRSHPGIVAQKHIAKELVKVLKSI